MERAVRVLESFAVPHEVRILSAHCTHEAARAFAEGALAGGVRIIIAAAGGAAHLAGFMAAHTLIPVLGVPIDSSPLSGVDALYTTVQMPPGIPVGTLAIGAGGVVNAALLAVQIPALSDGELRKRLLEYRREMAADMAAKDAELQKR